MATKPQIAVAITATDELSGVLDGIKKRMATAGREAREFGRDLDKSLESAALVRFNWAEGSPVRSVARE